MRAIPRVSQSQFTYFHKLTERKYRQRERKFLIEGVKLVQEALSSDWRLETLLVHREFLLIEDAREILRMAESAQSELLEISRDELKRLADTVTPQGIIGVVARREVQADTLFADDGKECLIVALDAISDPGNVGTMIRTCDWFGADAVVLSKNSVELSNPKTVRSTMGSLFHLPICSDVELLQFIPTAKAKGFKVIATTLEGGKALEPASFAKKNIVIFGSESHGVSQEILPLADDSVKISRFGKAESLNVGIACGIVLSAWRVSMT